eukprot:gene12767-biopygen8525
MTDRSGPPKTSENPPIRKKGRAERRAERRAAPCCRVAVWRAPCGAVRRRAAASAVWAAPCGAVRRYVPCGQRRAAPCGAMCRVGSAVRRCESRWPAGPAG